MRFVVGNLREASEENLLFARQLGVSGITLNTPLLRGQGSFGSGTIGQSYWARGDEEQPTRWDYFELLQLRERIESYGLKLEAIENTPVWFYDKAMLGLEGRDEQIENYQHTIRAMGMAGIPILGYHWMPTRVWRTTKTRHIRGNAMCSAFDADLVDDRYRMFDREFAADDMFANYEHFITAVLPVAEEAGVKLALHPDDPPVPQLGGVARIFRNVEGFKRAMEMGDSPNHGLDFCMGTWTEAGVDVMMESLRTFGRQGKIFYVHFRNVVGELPSFREGFIDEGEADLVAVLRELQNVGFNGFLIDDHVPAMVNDTEWGHRSRAYATGYIRGIIRAVQELAEVGTTEDKEREPPEPGVMTAKSMPPRKINRNPPSTRNDPA